MEDINRVLHWEKGIAKCPYSPHANVTSLLSVTTGQYFAGTPMDFSGADPAIIRDLGSTSNLRTNQYNSNWLNEPQFVGSFETDTHVYFLFRESAVEHINCGKVSQIYFSCIANFFYVCSLLFHYFHLLEGVVIQCFILLIKIGQICQ